MDRQQNVEILCDSEVFLLVVETQGCERKDLPGISDDDPVWESVAHSLAGLCASLILVVSPERIVLSGGVMNRTILYGKVRSYSVQGPLYTQSATSH